MGLVRLLDEGELLAALLVDAPIYPSGPNLAQMVPEQHRYHVNLNDPVSLRRFKRQSRKVPSWDVAILRPVTFRLSGRLPFAEFEQFDRGVSLRVVADLPEGLAVLCLSSFDENELTVVASVDFSDANLSAASPPAPEMLISRCRRPKTGRASPRRCSGAARTPESVRQIRC